MRLAVLALVLASAPALAAPKLPAHYAPMFERGHRWTFSLATTGFDYVEQRDGTMRAVPMAPERSTFTCSVTEVSDAPGAKVATIECDREIDSAYSFRPDGTWVATAQGLYRDVDLGDLKALAKLPPVMRASPRTSRVRTKDTFGGFYVAAVTSPAKGTWCATEDTTKGGAGDGAIVTTCFKAGAGLVSGTLDYHGGTPRIVEYTLAAQ